MEHQICRFAKMILRDRCSTSYDLASIFRGRRREWKNRKTHWYEAVSAALNFPFLKEVSQNCFAFDVVKTKIEEVSQNYFVVDVVKCKNCRRLVELFRF